jgi:hypothetical protein
MRQSVLVILAAAAVTVAAPAAYADNGGSTCQSQTTTSASLDTSQVSSDIAKLNTDVQTRHQDLDADIQTLTTDATNGAAAGALIADRTKIQSDFSANEAVVRQDRAQVESDAKALLQSVGRGCGARKAALGQLGTLLKSAEQALRTELAQFVQENQQLRAAAMQAVQQDRGQHRGQGQGSGSGGGRRPGRGGQPPTSGNG